MIEFMEGGRHYRGYTAGHCFCDGVEIPAQVFYEVMRSRHPKWQ